MRVEASLPHQLPLLGGVVVEVVGGSPAIDNRFHIVPGAGVVDPRVGFEPRPAGEGDGGRFSVFILGVRGIGKNRFRVSWASSLPSISS